MSSATKNGRRSGVLPAGAAPSSSPAAPPGAPGAMPAPPASSAEADLLARVNSIGVENVVVTLLDFRDGQGAHLHTERREDVVRGDTLAARAAAAGAIIENAAELRLHFLRRAAEALRLRDAASAAASLVEAEESEP